MACRNNMHRTVAVLMASLFCVCNVATQRTLQLVDNGYEGLVVGISNEVPQDQCNRVIHGIKVVFTKFSSYLWDATEGRSFLRDIQVILPNSWKTNTLACSLLQPPEASAPPTKFHVSITLSHPLFGAFPWTQQTQGCGRQGDLIQMGSDILRSSSNETHLHTARLLLSEWAKFRWGVFANQGFENDPLYPPFYKDPKTNELTANKCPSVEANPMGLCDDKEYVPEAPTKHNALCLGRSPLQVIKHSQDFGEGRNPPLNRSLPQTPVIRFVQESSPRFVLAVEDTAVMNMQRRWEFVRKAVRRIAVYDVPDGAYMALVVFNSVAKTVAPLSKMDAVTDVRQRVGSSLPRNPSTVPESHKCVLCGLQEALRALDSDSVSTSGAHIIIVTTGAATATHHQMDEMVRLIEERGVRVTPVVYPLTDRPGTVPSSTSTLEPLIKANKREPGRMFTVMDEGVGNDSKVSMMVALMDSLLAAVRLTCPQDNPGTPVVVHSEAYQGGISSVSDGSFILDDSFAEDARFSVYYYDLNHVGNTIQLTTPSGNVMASVNMQEEDGDANVIFVNIPNAERGRWRYKVENRADSHQGLHVQVTAHVNSKRKISVHLWTSATGSPLNISDPTQPIILYAEVKDGSSPVLGANVRVKLQRLGTNATGSVYKPIYIELLDNGIGDPDITKGDGIYSRYLPQMYTMPGHYELSVAADHNNGLARSPTFDPLTHRMYGQKTPSTCCGSVLHYDRLKPVSEFRRDVTFGVLNVVSRPDKDMIPPSRILDLTAAVNEATRDVKLTWSAPGDDYDWGRADHYEAVLATSWSQAKAFDGERIPNLPVPSNVYIQQSMKISVDKYDQTLYVALRAVDAAGNRGGLSSIVSFWVSHPPTTRPPVTTPYIDYPVSNSAEPQEHGLTQPVRVAGLDLEDMAVIAGALGGLLIIIAVISLFCYIHVNRRRKNQEKKETEKGDNNASIMIKTNSSMILDQDESRDSADSAIKDGDAFKDGRPLSPMQSWAASKLLAEHEQRFSVTNTPVVEQHCSSVHYGPNSHDPFPDVTLTGTHSYPSSQTPSTTHSDPPAYQPPYSSEPYSQYPYAYHQNYAHEELPPYTPGMGSQSQSSQASTVYSNEVVSQPSDLSYPHEANYPHDMPAFVSDSASYGPIPNPMYGGVPEVAPRSTVSGRAKVPPPVAPKPQMGARTNGSPSLTSSVEPKRRNITQV